jgi:hypothetical protein
VERSSPIQVPVFPVASQLLFHEHLGVFTPLRIAGVIGDIALDIISTLSEFGLSLSGLRNSQLKVRL